MNGQATAMTDTAVAADLGQALDVHCDFTAEVALNREMFALAFLPAITLGSILWQSFALAFVYGGDAKTAFFLTKLAARSVQIGVTFIIDVLLVWLLYKSKVFTAAKLWPPVKAAKNPTAAPSDCDQF